MAAQSASPGSSPGKVPAVAASEPFFKGVGMSVWQNSSDTASQWTDYVRRKRFFGQDPRPFEKSNDFWNLWVLGAIVVAVVVVLPVVAVGWLHRPAWSPQSAACRAVRQRPGWCRWLGMPHSLCWAASNGAGRDVARAGHVLLQPTCEYRELTTGMADTTG